jgi:hypothetical protein
MIYKKIKKGRKESYCAVLLLHCSSQLKKAATRGRKGWKNVVSISLDEFGGTKEELFVFLKSAALRVLMSESWPWALFSYSSV